MFPGYLLFLMAMFLLSSILKQVLFLGKPSLHFDCSMVCRYVWIHNCHYAHRCVMYFFWDAINDFMMGRQSRFYFFEQTFVWVLPSMHNSFCSHFSKPFRTNALFLSFIFIIFCLLFFRSLKCSFFPKYYKYVIVRGISYGTWNSPSVTFLANIHDYPTNKEWRQEATLFRLPKETSIHEVSKQQRRWEILKLSGYRVECPWSPPEMNFWQ